MMKCHIKQDKKQKIFTNYFIQEKTQKNYVNYVITRYKKTNE